MVVYACSEIRTGSENPPQKRSIEPKMQRTEEYAQRESHSYHVQKQANLNNMLFRDVCHSGKIT